MRDPEPMFTVLQHDGGFVKYFDPFDVRAPLSLTAPKKYGAEWHDWRRAPVIRYERGHPKVAAMLADNDGRWQKNLQNALNGKRAPRRPADIKWAAKHKKSN